MRNQFVSRPLPLVDRGAEGAEKDGIMTSGSTPSWRDYAPEGRAYGSERMMEFRNNGKIRNRVDRGRRSKDVF